MSADTRGKVTFERRFDDGRVILWRSGSREDGSAEEIELVTSHCTNPDCDCSEMDLEVSAPAWSASGERLEEEGPVLEALLDLESGEVSTEGVVEDSHAVDLLTRLHASLEAGMLDHLRERFHRAKHQDDPTEWREADWEGIDREVLVPFFEVFPSRWDLSVISDGELYWALDLWCLRPGCSCTDVVIDFQSDSGTLAGYIQIDTRKGRPDGPDVDARGRELWNVLEADEPGILQELRKRRDAMRLVARQLPAFLGQSTTVIGPAKVGRNDPCPCGSGKKSKRCCG